MEWIDPKEHPIPNDLDLFAAKWDDGMISVCRQCCNDCEEHRRNFSSLSIFTIHLCTIKWKECIENIQFYFPLPKLPE